MIRNETTSRDQDIHKGAIEDGVQRSYGCA